MSLELQLKSSEEIASPKMPDKSKEETTSKPQLDLGKEKGVLDNVISNLLNDFTSAELLTQTLDKQSGVDTKSRQESQCEYVVSSMKCLHIRKPIFAKDRGKITSKKKCLRNRLNIVVAASQFQKPILWPAKFNSNNKKGSSIVINPPKLKVSQDQTNNKNEVSIDSKQNIKDESASVFGSIASERLSDLSFSCLSAQAKSVDLSESFQKKSIELTKRHSSGSLPPAKIIKMSHVASEWESSGEDSDNDNLISNVTMLGCGIPQNVQCQSAKTCIVSPNGRTSPLLATNPSEGNINRSCSQEIRMEEANVNELASYFENLLHIPRKMSSMAEMMYA